MCKHKKQTVKVTKVTTSITPTLIIIHFIQEHLLHLSKLRKPTSIKKWGINYAQKYQPLVNINQH